MQLLLLAGLSVLALTLTSSSLGSRPSRGPIAGQLSDFDARGKVAPTKAQLKAAKSIHGRVSWSSRGTPASIIHYGGYLATGLKAPSAGGGRPQLARRAQAALPAQVGLAPAPR